MAFTFVDVGKVINQEDLVNKSNPGNYTMILYTARGASPANLANITEATATGYAEVDMLGANWVINATSAAYPQVSFVLTSEESILGFAIKRDAVLSGWEDFSDGPYVIPAEGGTINVTFTQNYTA